MSLFRTWLITFMLLISSTVAEQHNGSMFMTSRAMQPALAFDCDRPVFMRNQFE